MTLDREVLRTLQSAAARPGQIVCFSGAGLSEPSGIGTFRDPGSGWWSQYDPMVLASPEGYADDPDLVMRWYAARRLQMAEARPNLGHRVLAEHPEIVQVTQNTDDLLTRAGAQNVLQLHGDITIDRCHASCGHHERIDLSNPPPYRRCPHCSRAGMRPAVVWFGEALPGDVWAAAESAVRACRVLLVVGTSAVVYPAAGLITSARQAGATIIVVNRESTGASSSAHHELLGSADDILPRILDPA